jgi:hypothetical protein
VQVLIVSKQDVTWNALMLAEKLLEREERKKRTLKELKKSQ